MKIIFIHPSLRSYRYELFEKLYNYFNIKFIFIKNEKKGLKRPKEWNSNSFDLDYDVGLLRLIFNWLNFCFFLSVNQYDLILSSPAEGKSSILSLIIAKIRRKKILLWGETWYLPKDGIWKKIQLKFIYYLINNADGIIGSGKKSSDFYKIILPKTEVFNAPNYVPPIKKIETSAFLESLKKKDKNIINKKIILYLSRVIKRKGLDYLIESFGVLEKSLPESYLIVVGSGPFLNDCKNLANKLNIRNIMFTGYVPSNEISLYYNICDVFVLPSIFYNDYPEPIGLVVCEALSVGKPVVVTNAVGASQYIENGKNGYVVEQRNVEGLYNAIFRILEKDTKLTSFGEKSIDIYNERLNLNNQYNSFKSAINKITDEN